MYNKLVIVGHLGNDPEMRYMADGTTVTNFSLATNRRWTNQGTGAVQEETTWYRVSVWGRQAEAANQYLSKGRQVLVEGRLRPDPHTGGPRLYTRQDGTVGTSFEVTAEVVRFLGGNGNGNGNGQGAGNGAGVTEGGAAATAYEEDEIPF